MKKFKVKALEQEQWERHYIIEADSKEEAEEKYWDDEAEKDCVYSETYNRENSVDNIEELN